MSLFVINAKKQYELPDEGYHVAVLADIYERKVESEFGPKQKITFVWLTEQLDSKGMNLRVYEHFNKSLHERSFLYKRLRSLRVNPGERFDLETLIGTNARLAIVHHESEGRTFANVEAALTPDKNAKPLTVPSWFTRKNGQDYEATDSDVPV